MEQLVSFDASRVRELAGMMRSEHDPGVIFEEASGRLPQSSKEAAIGALCKDGRKLTFALGISNQTTVAESVDRTYAPFAMSFARQLIEEYKCEAPSEISMAEMAAISYANFLKYAHCSSAFANDPFYHKQMDRSQRQYQSALSMLRQMKRPPLSVNMVSAQNAFIAQNQIAVAKDGD